MSRELIVGGRGWEEGGDGISRGRLGGLGTEHGLFCAECIWGASSMGLELSPELEENLAALHTLFLSGIPILISQLSYCRDAQA